MSRNSMLNDPRKTITQRREIRTFSRSAAITGSSAIVLMAFFGTISPLQGFPAPRNLAEIENDAEKLQGTWQLTTIEKTDGSISEKKPAEVTWTFTGNELSAVIRKLDSKNDESKKRFQRKFFLNRYLEVGNLDIQDEASGGAFSLWIYEIRGDWLTVSIGDKNGVDAAGNPVTIRPRTFTGSQQYTAHFKRVRE